MPQIERDQPEPIELVIVLIAPAPGVSEMRVAAASRVNQSDHDTSAILAPSQEAPRRGDRPQRVGVAASCATVWQVVVPASAGNTASGLIPCLAATAPSRRHIASTSALLATLWE